jgi:hypothetical protein
VISAMLGHVGHKKERAVLKILNLKKCVLSFIRIIILSSYFLFLSS